MIKHRCYLKNNEQLIINSHRDIPWDNLRYDENLPSVIQYNSNTNEIYMEQWVYDNTTYRINGPAIIDYSITDNSRYHWYWKGMIYNLNSWLIKNDELSNKEKVLIKLIYG